MFLLLLTVPLQLSLDGVLVIGVAGVPVGVHVVDVDLIKLKLMLVTGECIVVQVDDVFKMKNGMRLCYWPLHIYSP